MQLTEARTEAAQTSDVAEAMRLINDAVPNGQTAASGEIVRTMVADRRTALTRFNAAFTRARQLQPLHRRVASDEFSRELTAANVDLQRKNELLAARQDAVDASRLVIKSEEDADLIGAHFAALLEHGTSLGLQAGHCPLCDAVRTDTEFRAALDGIRSRLAGQAERLENAQRRLNSAEAELQASRVKVSELRTLIDGLIAEQIRYECGFR